MSAALGSFRDLVHGKVDRKEELAEWRERMREYLPCLDKDAEYKGEGTTLPLTPHDLAITDQAKQKTFLERDILR